MDAGFFVFGWIDVEFSNERKKRTPERCRMLDEEFDQSCDMSSVPQPETLEKYWSAERREVPRDEGERGEVVYVDRVGWESIPGRKFVESVRGSPQDVFEELFR